MPRLTAENSGKPRSDNGCARRRRRTAAEKFEKNGPRLFSGGGRFGIIDEKWKRVFTLA